MRLSLYSNLSATVFDDDEDDDDDDDDDKFDNLNIEHIQFFV